MQYVNNGKTKLIQEAWHNLPLLKQCDPHPASCFNSVRSFQYIIYLTQTFKWYKTFSLFIYRSKSYFSIFEKCYIVLLLQ